MSTNVSLTPELEKYLQKKVQSGGYKSVSEVIREGLRLLKEKDKETEIKLRTLKLEVQKGLESGNSSLLNMDSIKEQGRKRLQALNKKKK
jgi:antitoxin ParD1/3/4